MKSTSKKESITKVIIVILAIILVYAGTRTAYYFITSPKQVDGDNSTTVYEMVNLVDDFMEKHDIDYAKGSQKYIDWLSESMMGQIDKEVYKDLKKEKWYDEFETYAVVYLTEAQTIEMNPIMEFLGYNKVIPKNMRDKKIHELEEYLSM